MVRVFLGITADMERGFGSGEEDELCDQAQNEARPKEDSLLAQANDLKLKSY